MPDKTPDPQPPEGYKPLNVKERQQWNSFLDYLDSQGISGHPELDKRSQTLGLSYMDKYKKVNPDFSITPDRIKDIQYEQYMLRKGSSFPTMDANQLNIIRQHLSPNYINRDVSPVDSWLGSLTSKEYYPQGKIVGAKSKDYGTDVEGYSKALLGQ